MKGIIYVLIVFFIILILFYTLYQLNQTNHYFSTDFKLQRIYHLRSNSYVVLRLAAPYPAPVKTIRGGGDELINAYVPVMCVGGTANDPFGLWTVTPNPAGSVDGQLYYSIRNNFIKSYCSQAFAQVTLYTGTTSAATTIFLATEFNFQETSGTPATNPNAWFKLTTPTLQPIIIGDNGNLGAAPLFTITPLRTPNTSLRWVPNLTKILKVDTGPGDEFQLRPPII